MPTSILKRVKKEQEAEERVRSAVRRTEERLGISKKDAADFLSWCKERSPNFTWDWTYQKFIGKQLQRITDKETDRLMLFAPPRHGKSTIVTVFYAAWRLERNPKLRIVIGCYGKKLANKFSREIKRLLAGRVALSKEKNATEEWETIDGGGVLAVSRGSGVVGYGADLILVDDSIKNRMEAESDTHRDNVKEWFDAALYTRQEPGCAIVMMNTRWHTHDLSGQLLEEQEEGGDTWEIVSLPALAEENDPLGRAVGEALCPERFNSEQLARIKAKQVPYEWSSQYQQQPVPNEGAVFKLDWFKDSIRDKAPDGLRWVRYWDLAASIKTTADYTACVAIAFDAEGNLWIRDMVHGRWEWPDARREMIKTMRSPNEKRTRHGVEKALHGIAAVQELLREPAVRHIPIQSVPVTIDKLSRALSWSSRASEGKVRIVRGAWVQGFLKEACLFTGKGDTHDDQVDTVSGGVLMLSKRSGKLLTF